jgi:hypothetical protein
MAVGRIAVSDQITRHFIRREGVTDLPRDPLHCWVTGNPYRYNLPPLMAQDHQSVQQSKADGRHDQEVHCGDPRRVVARASWRGWRRPARP